MKSFFADTVELCRSCVVRDFQGGGGRRCEQNKMAAKRARVSCSPDSFLKEIREVKELLGSIKTFTSQLNLSKFSGSY